MIHRLKKRQRPGRNLKQANPFGVMSSVLAMMGSVCFVSSLQSMEAHQLILPSNNGVRQGYRLDVIMRMVRGGATGDDNDEETAELDAYIEQLLGEVDDDEDAKVENTKSKKGTLTKKVGEKAGKPSKNLDAGTKTKSKVTVAPTLKKKGPTASSPKISADEKKASVPMKKAKTKSTETSKVKVGLKKGTTKKSIETAKEQMNQTEVTVSSEAHASMTAANATTIPPLPPGSIEPRRHSPLPNALYRFLLRRGGGFGGRSTVLLLVTTSEFFHTYLPPLAHVGDWVLCKIFPPPKDGMGRRRRPDRPTSSSVNVASVSRMARTGVSRSKRRKFTQQADQQALAQLQQRPASELRYTFCSQAFCQRHGLGKWASLASKSRPSETEDALEVGEEYSVQETGVDSKPAKKRKKKQDWVLASLTKAPRRKRSPTLSLGVGSTGLTIGVELDWSGQKERVMAALTLPPKRPKVSVKKLSNTTPRKSDSDGGMVGRLRAAAGSSVARSLSGAYPGDALPVDAAGNSLGLADFAAKYGYGDWSESDDGKDNFGMGDFGGEVGPKRRRRRHKPKQKKEPGSFWDDIDVSFSAGSSSDRRRRRHSPRKSRSEIPLSSSPTLSRRTKSASSSSPSLGDKRRTQMQERSSKSPAKSVASRRVEMAKSPLSRTQELKKKSSQKSDDD